jgi:elongation of very long chain fatty acids protein 6
MEYVEAFFAEMHGYRGQEALKYMRAHTEIPVAFVTLYFVLVFYVPEKMKVRDPMNLKPFFKVWNLILALFSIMGAYYTVPALIDYVLDKGFRFTVCAHPETWYFTGAPGFWTFLFMLSKFPELLDTVFLVLQKKPVIFLHWFHHCTVMLYCWHAYLVQVPTGFWFATMNFSVHSIMYAYYFFMCFKATQFVKKINFLITTLQIAQMIMGMVVSFLSWFWWDSKNCNADLANVKMGLAMYISYFVLFCSLFKDLYLSGSKKSRGSDSRSVCNSAEGAATEFTASSRIPLSSPLRKRE